MSDRRFNTVLYWCACALLLGVVVFGMSGPLLAIGRYIPLDPNEGWNAYFGDAAVSGGVLYPPADALITNNYPPLSFYIVGAVGHLTGDSIFAGRAIALASLLFVAWSIYYWLRMDHWPQKVAADNATRPPGRGASAKSAAFSSQIWAGYRGGVFAALTFLAYAVTYGRVYVAMDDPQWLAHALMFAGLLLVWKGKDNTRHLVLGAVLMMAAGWTKHLLIPLPATVAIWLLWRSRPAFAKWAVSATVTLAVAAAVAWWLHGARLFESLNEPRQYLRWKATTEATVALQYFAPLAVLWLVALVKGGLHERLGFVSLYLGISAAVGFFAAGGAGVDVNAFFDPLIALCLVTGLALEGLTASSFSWEPVVGIAVAICTVGYSVMLAPLQLQGIRNLDADERDALGDIELIKADGHGRAACEKLDLCYWAKSEFMIDFFYFGQKLKTGALPGTACADTFEHGDITLVQLDANPRYRAKLLPNDCDALITARYHTIRESRFGPLLMRPRATASR